MKKLLLFVTYMLFTSLLFSCGDDEDDAFSPMQLPASASDTVYEEDEVDANRITKEVMRCTVTISLLI